MTTPKEFLSGGGGAPTAKFPTVGTEVGGFITKPAKVSQQQDMNQNLKFWDDGSPMEQLEVTVLTDERDPEISDDDGSRRIFVKGQMRSAVIDAVQDAGADELLPGGLLTVTYVGEKPSTKKGFNAAKQYEASYKAPTTSAVTSTTSFGDEEPF